MNFAEAIVRGVVRLGYAIIDRAAGKPEKKPTTSALKQRPPATTSHAGKPRSGQQK